MGHNLASPMHPFLTPARCTGHHSRCRRSHSVRGHVLRRHKRFSVLFMVLLVLTCVLSQGQDPSPSSPTDPPTDAPGDPPTDAPGDPPTDAPEDPPTYEPAPPPTPAETNPPTTDEPAPPPTPAETDPPPTDGTAPPPTPEETNPPPTEAPVPDNPTPPSSSRPPSSPVVPEDTPAPITVTPPTTRSPTDPSPTTMPPDSSPTAPSASSPPTTTDSSPPSTPSPSQSSPESSSSSSTPLTPPSATDSSSSTLSPSNQPSGQPTTWPLQRILGENITMTLEGVEPLNAVSQSLWRVETEKYLAGFISDMLEGQVRDVDVAIDLTSQDPPFVESKKQQRRLQANGADGVTLIFNAVLSMETWIEEPDFNDYILIAFESEEARNAYMELLKATDDPAFADITSVSVTPATSVTPIRIADDSGNDGGSDSTTIGIIVGAVVGGVAVVGLVVIFASTRWRSRWKPPTNSTKSKSSQENEIGPCGDEIEIVGARDDISTLGDPIPPHLRNDLMMDDPTAVRSTADSLTADYDFQKAYRSGQLSVVDTTITEPNPSTLVSKDGTTLEAVYSSPKETQFEVEAPAGLLGVVLETSEEGVPVVHVIKETSCLALEVQVGDRLVAVDGEDVSTMGASSVSRLIASKKDNPVRKFLFTRPEEI